MSENLAPKLCSVCDRTYDDCHYMEDTDRALYFHHSQHQMCVVQNGQPAGTFELSASGVSIRRDD